MKTSKKTETPRGEDRKRGVNFLRLFGKYDIRNEQQFVYMGKWLIFIVLVIVEALTVLGHLASFKANGGWKMLTAIVVVETILTLSQSLKFFVLKGGRGRTALYVMDAVAAFCLTFVAVGSYTIIIYMLVLTSFYFDTEKTRPSVAILCIVAMLYVASNMVRSYVIYAVEINVFTAVTQSFSTLFAFAVHFLIVQVALAFYRQFLRLDKALGELDESKRELEKAYAVVAEVSALEERQRIAREIHDTAGHSITTVIMQTEAAKMIIDRDAAEAKQKIVAANLQAKHALEELRDSVHLLSGVKENKTLKMALEDIVHESTDGTGIKIRSEIDEIAVSQAKERFLCNTLKECISNGLRHGNATAFWFECKIIDGKIRFLLSDNGRGVEMETLALGFGLSGIRDRARALGGEVHFHSETGEGFETELLLPADEMV